MPILITATLDQPTLVQLLRELTPFTVALGESGDNGRRMVIEPPESVVFEGGQGVRVRTSAKVHWTVASAPLSFSLTAVHLMLRPSIVGGRLNVLPVILEADFKNVPEFIDRTLVKVANDRLAAEAARIGWDFARTLALRLALPAAMAPLTGFEMDAADATLEMRADALCISLALPMHFVAPR